MKLVTFPTGAIVAWPLLAALGQIVEGHGVYGDAMEPLACRRPVIVWVVHVGAVVPVFRMLCSLHLVQFEHICVQDFSQQMGRASMGTWNDGTARVQIPRAHSPWSR